MTQDSNTARQMPANFKFEIGDLSLKRSLAEAINLQPELAVGNRRAFGCAARKIQTLRKEHRKTTMRYVRAVMLIGKDSFESRARRLAKAVAQRRDRQFELIGGIDKF